MRYLLLLLLFLAACADDSVQRTGMQGTDTFLQRMAANADHADMKAGHDSLPDCGSVLYWALLTGDLSKKNKNYDTAVHIHPHAYNIAHTAINEDSLLIWISYKPNDTGIIKTMAWLEMDVKHGRLFDVTGSQKQPVIIAFDTAQLYSLRCRCIYEDNSSPQTRNGKVPSPGNLKMIRGEGSSGNPDYGKVF